MNKPAPELIALADELKTYIWQPIETRIYPTKLMLKIDAALRIAANQSGSERAGVDGDPLAEQLRGRAQFLRECGEIKSPELMERAAEALATPPAQPALASGDEVERLRDALSLALQYLPAQPSGSDAQKDIARIHDLIAGKAAAWDEAHVSEAPSTHGKPDGAVREAALRLLAAEDERQSQLHDLLETIREQIRLEVPVEHRPAGLFKNIQDAVYATRGRTPLMNDAAVTAALHSPRIAVAETSPGDVLAMKEALDLLQLEQRGRAQAFRLLDQARSVSDPATLAKADAYEECGNELRAALSPETKLDDTVECPACRYWMTERVCEYCNGSGEVTEQQFRDFGSEP